MPSYSDPKAARVGQTPGGFACWIGLARVLAGIVFCVMLYTPFAGMSTPLSTSYSLTFLWDSSPSPDVVCYRVYYGGTSGAYTNSVIAGGTTTATISGLSCGVTYYFAVTAVSVDGQESGFSEELMCRREFPGAQLELHRLPGGGYKLTVAGLSGRSYDVQATTDLKTWTFIGTATVGADGFMDFIDPNAALFSHRFYRTQESQPVEAAFARARLQIQGGAGKSMKLTVTGLAGHTYDIEATEDFRVWTVISTMMPATDGPVDFTDPNAGNFSQRFYRTRENP